MIYITWSFNLGSVSAERRQINEVFSLRAELPVDEVFISFRLSCLVCSEESTLFLNRDALGYAVDRRARSVRLQDRLLAERRSMLIIFVTAFPDDGVEDRATKAGLICFLTKPFDGPTLINALEILKRQDGTTTEL